MDTPSLFDHALVLFKQGGPVMWPILICSLAAFSVTFERLIAFWKYNFANYFFKGKQTSIIEMTRKGNFNEALAQAKKADSAICRIFCAALTNIDTSFQSSLEAASQQEIDRLRRGFTILDTAITASPMLGILGTVTGIINTFNMLNASGIENPTGATAGIAEALITTAAGLIVAIGCLFPFNFLLSLLNRKTHELEQVLHQFEVAYNQGVQAQAQKVAAPQPPAENG